MNIEISVVVPCYNEEGGIHELVKRLMSVLRKLKMPHEIILVNDGSTDKTWAEIKAEATKHKSIIGINFSRNFGQNSALSAGLKQAKGKLVMIVDADLQNPPECLPDMLKKMEETGADVVYGHRIKRKGDTWFKVFTSRIFSRILYYLSDHIFHTDSGEFRIMKRKVVDAVNSMPESVRFLRGLFSWVGFKNVSYRYEAGERFAGETHYSFTKMLRLAMDAITGFSVKPLRIAFIFGIISAFLGLVMFGYVVYAWLYREVVVGWSSIAGILLIMMSAQFILLGLIGEYIGRIFMEAKRRPHYIVQEIYRKEKAHGKK